MIALLIRVELAVLRWRWDRASRGRIAAHAAERRLRRRYVELRRWQRPAAARNTTTEEVA